MHLCFITGSQDAAVQEAVDNFSEDLLFKDLPKSSITIEPFPGKTKIDLVRKRRGYFESVSTVDSSVDSDGEDDNDAFNRTSSDENRKFARANHCEIEKRRRDKMNTYISELSTLVPTCSTRERKLDKLTVLRMTVQHMKTLQASDAHTEVSHKPSFLSNDELKHLILKAADGFLFVVSCDRGRMLYVSESVRNVLHYTQSELIGQSLFDILHPKDITKIKEQLLSSDLAPRERLIDAKTMLPLKSELPHTQSHLCSGARRAFICRMKTGTSIKEEDPQAYMCNKKNKADQKNYSVIHCTGYLKSWPPVKVGIEQEDSEGDSEAYNLSCLVAIGNFLPPYTALEESVQLEVQPTQFMSRCTPDGKFIYIDQSATAILGYLPQELLGTSVYEYYHSNDIELLSETHKKVLTSTEKLESPVYQFKRKDGSFVHLKTKAFRFKNPWTKEIDYILATNTVVPVDEVSSSGQSIDIGNMGVDDVTPDDCNKPQGLPAGTRPGAGRIGRQIAEQVLEIHNEDSQAAIDSSLKNVQPYQTDTSIVSGADGPNQETPSASRLNGLIEAINNTVQTGGPLLSDIMEQETMSESNPDTNDGAAMAEIMSLLEADAGLGGPVDFTDLTWPL